MVRLLLHTSSIPNRRAIAWAKDMGHAESVKLLQQILDQEKAADQKLTTIGQGGVNQQAASHAQAHQRELVGTSGRQSESRRS